MSGKVEKVGKETHPLYGECVRVKYVSDGITQTYVFPRDQLGILMHPRHPTGIYTQTTKLVIKDERACVSPSCSFYGDLCKTVEFRWNSVNKYCLPKEPSAAT